MDILYINPDLYIKYINKDKGWGVFTKSKIKTGDIIERIYSLPVNISVKDFHNYFFEFNGTDTLLPLGYGCVYNHSDSANISWRITDREKYIMEFYVIKDVEIDEELCHNYGSNYWINKDKKII